MINNVNAIYNNASSSTLTSSTQSASALKNEFMQMLITQLKNQDPTNPVDDSEMVTQQAQFASLEQLQNMNTNLVSLMAMQNVSQAVGLVGKAVTGLNSDGATVSGTVSSLVFDNGTPQLKLSDGTIVALSNVETISN